METNWVPTLNAKFVLESIMTLLSTPNAEHALENEIAELLMSDKAAFEAKAKEYTAEHAK
jgi:ubiquitin-protein ligase